MDSSCLRCLGQICRQVGRLGGQERRRPPMEFIADAHLFNIKAKPSWSCHQVTTMRPGHAYKHAVYWIMQHQ